MKKSIVYVLLAASAIMWGVSFILTKELFNSEPHITVLIILTFRLILASAVTMPVLLALRQLEPIKKGHLKWFLLLALLEPFIYSICETSGVQLVSGSMSAIVVATIPLFVPFGMAIAFKERIRGVTLLGIVLSLVGLGIMVFMGENSSMDANPKGLAWLLGAVLTAVFFTLVMAKLVKWYKPFTITAYQNFFGCLYFIPVMLAVDHASLPMLSYSGKMIGLILVLGIACSTLAYVFYCNGVAHLGATSACIITNSIPIFSFIAALIIGQETFSWAKPIGILVVLLGVVMAQLPPKSKAD
ncbi:MAG: DMT family transporter [Bacteroidales bacterium]|nr:DMT family transporter [Candidatus Colimorpha merdihippi]